MSTIHGTSSNTNTIRSSRRRGTFVWCVVLVCGTLLCLTPGLPSWLGWIVFPSYLVLLCAAAWRWR